MTPTDAEIQRNIRRELSKREFDSNRLDIQVNQGRVMLAGMINMHRNYPTADLKYELDTFLRILNRDPLIRELSNAVRIIEKTESHDKKDEHARGRMRH
jgi:hypothetical protein